MIVAIGLRSMSGLYHIYDKECAKLVIPNLALGQCLIVSVRPYAVAHSEFLNVKKPLLAK